MMFEKYGTEKETYEIHKKAYHNNEDKVVAKNLTFDEAVVYLNKDANYELIPQKK